MGLCDVSPLMFVKLLKMILSLIFKVTLGFNTIIKIINECINY